jgi:hypothetical protein
MADINISLTLDDSQFQTIIKRVDTSVISFGNDLKKVMADGVTAITGLNTVMSGLSDRIGTLTTSLNANKTSLSSMSTGLDEVKTKSANFQGSIQSVTSRLEGMGAALLGVGLLEFAKHAIEGSANSAKLAEALGISTQSFIEMNAAANIVGISQEQLAKGISRFTVGLDAAQSGTGRQAVLLEKLGLSAQELAKMPLAEAFNTLTKAIGESTDATLKAEASRSFIGRNAATANLKAYSEQYEQLKNTMIEQAAAADVAEQAIQKLKAGFGQFSQNVTMILSPLTSLIGDNGKGLLGSKVAAESFVAVLGIGTLVAAVKAFETLSGAVKGLFGSFFTASGGAELLRAEASKISALLPKLIAEEEALAAAVQSAAAAFAYQTAASYTAAGNLEAYEVAMLRLNAAQEALAIKQAVVNKVAQEANTAIAAQTGILAGLSASFRGLFVVIGEFVAAIGAVILVAGAPVWATIAAGVAAIGVAITAGITLWRAYGDYVKDILSSIGDGISYVVGKFGDMTAAMARALPGSKMAPGSKSGEVVVSAKKMSTEEIKAYDTAEEEAAANKAKAEADENNRRGLSIVQLQNKLSLMKEEAAEAVKRINLEISLMNSGDEYRKHQLAIFDIEKQRNIEITRLKGEIDAINADQNKTNALKKEEIGAINQTIDAVNQKAAGEKKALTTLQERQDLHQEDKLQELQLQQIIAKTNEINGKAAATEQGLAALRRTEIDTYIDQLVEARVKTEELFLKTGKLTEEQRKNIREQIMGLKEVQGLYTAQNKLSSADITKSINKISGEEEARADKELLTLKTQLAELTMTSDEKAIAAIIRKREEEKINVAEKMKGFATDSQIVAQMSAIDKLYDPIIAKQRELNATSRQFGTGWKDAFNQYFAAATNSAEHAKTVFNSATGNMESSIDKFVKTGKFSFHDMTISIIQDIIAMELKAMAAMFIKSLFGGIGGIFGALAGHASGGQIPDDRPVLVGENGPEIISGMGGRMVTPNHEIGNLSQSDQSGGQTVNYNYTIHAMDSRSVAQVFAENRMTMFGMVEKARREMPLRTR